jgi:phospholipid/cholesterol/gamma-HCH transport system substrate-binding protein
MRRNNEFFVGLAIVIAVLIGFGGTRFFQGTPLFGGGFTLVGVFEDSQGLTPGNVVRLSGVRVGQVESVRLAPSADRVYVTMQIDRGVAIPGGAELATGGIAALGDVNIALKPGPPGNPPLANGDTLYARGATDMFASLQRDATGIMASAGTTLASMETMIDAESDLRQMLASLRGATATLDQLLRTEQVRLAATLQNFQAASASVSELTSSVSRIASTQSDSIALAISNLNRTLENAELTMHHLGATSAELDVALTRINSGDGSLGLLLNDPTLYYQLDSTLTNINSILGDFQENPRKYLRELRLVKIF